MDTRDAIWQNKPDRFARVRIQAKSAREHGEPLCAHSIMLSFYITVLGGKPVEGHHPTKFGLLAMWHAFWLSRHWEKLNYNQLDVLVQFLLKLRSKWPLLWQMWPIDVELIVLAERELNLVLADKNSKPHQVALSFMTIAESAYTGRHSPGLTLEYLHKALWLQSAVCDEHDQPQGLRQLVRILRKAGELYGLLGFVESQESYLRQALSLAIETDSQDQVEKIRELLRKMDS